MRRVARGGGALQLLSALAGLFAGGSAQAAAGEAEHAAKIRGADRGRGVAGCSAGASAQHAAAVRARVRATHERHHRGDASARPIPQRTAATTAPCAPTTVVVEPLRDRRPRPRASTALLVLAVLAVGYTLWAAQALILPVLLAMFFALIGNPIIRLLQRLRIPRFVGALLVLVLRHLLGGDARPRNWWRRPANGSARRRARCANSRPSCATSPSRCRRRTRPRRTSPAPPAARPAASRCRWSGPRSTIPTRC